MAVVTKQSEEFEQQVRIKHLATSLGTRQVLYDAGRIKNLDPRLFEPDECDRIENNEVGRAQVIMHRYQNLELVNRHYYRGGWLAFVLGDRYLGRKADASRSFREWCMLSTMLKQGLPVPTPIAASIIQQGFVYRADIVTERIPNVKTLADSCLHGVIDASLWSDIGKVIRRFHDCNVYHADLNARNILIDASGKISLIDFDKSSFRVIGEGWRAANLARLRRSLDKFVRLNAEFNFTESNWQSLVKAYSC